MPTLENSIIIDAPLGVIWNFLSEMDKLALYDPAVASSKVLSDTKTGVGSTRRVEMKDYKNWFEEKCTLYQPEEALEFQLTACSFPVDSLKHVYTFNKINHNKYQVTQHQTYQMKYGILGWIMGALIKTRWNKGIKSFLKGLKDISEQHGL